MHMQNRTLDWDGSFNIRDLGGLPSSASSTGVTIAHRIVRGPRREWLTEAGWATASDWGLKSIVDLRNADEVGRRDSDPVDATPSTIVISSAPTEDQDDPEFQRLCFPILDSPEYWQHNIRLLPHLVNNALCSIADSAPGTLIHCSAGRDRTGMITAILLAIAGVDHEHIVADYATSVRAMAGMPPHMRSSIDDQSLDDPNSDRQSEWTPAQVNEWLTEITHHIFDFLGDIDAHIALIGLPTATRETLRSRLTEA